jgi:PAS domain S-box-containing protein
MKDKRSSQQLPKEQTAKQNITELEQAKESHRQSEEISRLMIESATDFAIFKVGPDGAVDYWNIGAERVFGFRESEIVGKNFDILFTPEDREKAVPQKELETARREGRAENERWHLRKDGTRFFASGVINPLKGDGAGFVKIARDRTDKLAAEKAERDKEMLQKLVHWQEDERKRIARDLHDEVGQQITALRFALEQVRKFCEDDKEASAKVDDAQTLAKRVDNGIDFLAWELRPSVLDDLGLYAALEKYIKEWSQHARFGRVYHCK